MVNLRIMSLTVMNDAIIDANNHASPLRADLSQGIDVSVEIQNGLDAAIFAVPYMSNQNIAGFPMLVQKPVYITTGGTKIIAIDHIYHFMGVMIQTASSTVPTSGRVVATYNWRQWQEVVNAAIR